VQVSDETYVLQIDQMLRMALIIIIIIIIIIVDNDYYDLCQKVAMVVTSNIFNPGKFSALAKVSEKRKGRLTN